MQASDEAMRLMVEFGDDSLLMSFVGTVNQIKLEVGTSRAILRAIRSQSQSSTRNMNIQLLATNVNDLRIRASKFKESVLEIGRND